MSDQEFKRNINWYVPNDGLTYSECLSRDDWCWQVFNDYRHDCEIPEGWWLQTEEEYSLFLMRWGC